MEKQRLLETLEQLHAEVSQAERVDPETLAELERLTGDIHRALKERGEKRAPKVEHASAGLNDLLLKFEAEHPQLAASIGRVADALAAMGI